MENYFILIVYIVIICIVIKNNREKKNNNENNNKESEQENELQNEINNKKEINYNKNYYKKDKLLTDNEKLFYKVLKESIKDKDIIIQTQVVLYQIIKPKQNNDFYINFNKIRAKSIDYVLVDKDFKILLCIELDDRSHDNQERIKRDEFLNQLFKETNTRLIRVAAQPYYNVDRIKKLIEECL